MKTGITAYISGVLFGLGLCISEMINPTRVIGFLDIAGQWDPTLLLVMCGALAMTIPLFHIVLARKQPFFAKTFSLPVKTTLDKRLLTGAVLFGIGWGLAGLCPGPAITALAGLSNDIIGFVIAMMAGMWIAMQFQKK